MPLPNFLDSLASAEWNGTVNPLMQKYNQIADPVGKLVGQKLTMSLANPFAAAQSAQPAPVHMDDHGLTDSDLGPKGDNGLRPILQSGKDKLAANFQTANMGKSNDIVNQPTITPPVAQMPDGMGQAQANPGGLPVGIFGRFIRSQNQLP